MTKRAVDALEPEDKPWIAWDDKLTGFGVRVHPSGAKAFLVNYRAGNGGRKAPNKRVVVGRAGRMTPDQARRRAQELLGRVATGEDPAGARAEARGLPRLGEACEDYIMSGHGWAASTERGYRRYAALYLGDWLSRPLDGITRRDVESRFRLLTERHGEIAANQCLSFLRSVYRRPCVDHEGLRNPVEQWLAGGGRYHRKTRKRISSPAEVLPCWRKGIEAAVGDLMRRDAFLFGLYTGMRRGEVMPLQRERVDLCKGLFPVEETKTGVPLELPVTRQLEQVLARRQEEGMALRRIMAAHCHSRGMSARRVGQLAVADAYRPTARFAMARAHSCFRVSARRGTHRQASVPMRGHRGGPARVRRHRSSGAGMRYPRPRSLRMYFGFLASSPSLPRSLHMALRMVSGLAPPRSPHTRRRSVS